MSEGLHRVEYFLKEMCAWQEAADVEAARHRIDRYEKEIERLRARLETVRHEAQAATKLVLEHQSKNCHLNAEIERLREALGDN